MAARHGAEQRYDGKASGRTAQDGTHNARHYPTRNWGKRYQQHSQESKA